MALHFTKNGKPNGSNGFGVWRAPNQGKCDKLGLSFAPANETIKAHVAEPHLIAPAIFHVAAASQQLFALATAHKERNSSDFKARLLTVIQAVCAQLHVPVIHDAVLPIGGDWVADHLIGDPNNPLRPPLIVIAATSATRLLEAEVVHMQYRHMKQRGFVLAVAESSKAVGIKQFNRANYYTGKTVEFNEHHLEQLMAEQLA